MINMTKEKALHKFWSSFGWQFYDENTVPDDALLPYGTYNVVVDSIGTNVALSVSLWQRSKSWVGVTEKADEINAAIGMGGVMVPYDGGCIWIRRGHPFTQRMSDEDDGIRRMYLNITAEYESAD